MKTTWVLALALVVGLLALPLMALAQDIETPPNLWLERLQTAATVSFIVGGLIGALAGGGSALAMLSRVDRDTKDNAERLFTSLSPEWQATITQVVTSAEEAVRTAAMAVELLREVTDGQPNSEAKTGE
jgi:glycerol uptake facilitator-like aquaporin